MNALLDGLVVFINNWQVLAGIFLLVLVSQFLIRSIVGDDISTSEIISLSLAGWLVPASILSMLWVVLGMRNLLWIATPLLIVFILFLPRLKSDRKPASPSTILFFALAVFFSLLIRLVLVAKALFPSYFDSPFHFSVANNIIEHGLTWTFNWLSANIYHINFHFLTAFFASAFDTEVTQVMLLLGQVFLAFIPFSLYFPVKRATESEMAGWFAVTVSAFGWYMPAHAVDWGKYPALLSLGLIVFILALASLLLQNAITKKRWAFYALLGLSILLSIFMHSRSLIVLGIAIIAWVTTIGWGKLSQRVQYLSLTFIVVAVILLAAFIQKQEILTLLFDPYLVKGLWITILVLALSVFAFISYPRLTFLYVLSMGLLLVSVFVPVSGLLPGRTFLTLLDRPFVEMILFLPLSLLGGLGLAALENTLQGRFAWGRYVGLLAIGIVLANAYFTYELYQSDCCITMGKDDVVALDWAANQLPVKARIGISSTEVKVNVANTVEGIASGDAGMWITPLTGHVTFLLPYVMEFDQPSALDDLCELRITHLYVGELGQTFDDVKLASRPEWYKPLLSMPKARVYEVIGCE